MTTVRPVVSTETTTTDVKCGNSANSSWSHKERRPADLHPDRQGPALISVYEILAGATRPRTRTTNQLSIGAPVRTTRLRKRPETAASTPPWTWTGTSWGQIPPDMDSCRTADPTCVPWCRRPRARAGPGGRATGSCRGTTSCTAHCRCASPWTTRRHDHSLVGRSGPANWKLSAGFPLGEVERSHAVQFHVQQQYGAVLVHEGAHRSVHVGRSLRGDEFGGTWTQCREGIEWVPPSPRLAAGEQSGRECTHARVDDTAVDGVVGGRLGPIIRLVGQGRVVDAVAGRAHRGRRTTANCGAVNVGTRIPIPPRSPDLGIPEATAATVRPTRPATVTGTSAPAGPAALCRAA